MPQGLSRDDQRIVARVIFAPLTAPTLGLLAAWDEAMRRWKELSAVIFSRVVDDDSDQGSDAMRREQIELMKNPEVRRRLPLGENSMLTLL